MQSGGCSGACARVEESTQAAEESDKFGVFCLTVSDRASRGQYESGDLSGKAMVECVTQMSGETMRVAGTRIVADEPE